MREIKNILFRRILYKIPLKFLLILFAIVAIFIASYSDAGLSSPVLLQTYTTKQTDQSYTNNNYDFLCLKNVNCSSLSILFNFNHGNGAYQNKDNVIGDLMCSQSHIIYFTTNYSCTFEIYGYKITDYTKAQCKSTYNLIEPSECSVMSSLECQTNYSLIPISSVNQSYCVNNNLCPSSECPVCPEGSGGVYSNVYINNILHLGAPNIIMNIPEEIDWDYAYSSGGNNMNIDVVGYNVDYDYINGQYDIQNFKPDSDDLSNIVSSILPLFIPGLVIILFLYFLFKFIKKIF